MPFDLKKSLEDGWSHEDVVNHLGPTINYDTESAVRDGWSYQNIAEHLSTQTYPPYNDTARALSKLQMPKITDGNNLTAFERHRIDTFLKSQPPEIAHATRTNAISEMKRRQYGEIRQEYPSFLRTVKNLPKNTIEAVEAFGALIVGIPMVTHRHLKEVAERKLEQREVFKEGRLPTKTEKEYLDRPYHIEEMIGEGVSAIKEGWPYFKEEPLLHTGFWVEEHPADTILIGMGAWQVGGAATRGGMNLLSKTTGKQVFKNALKTEGRQSWEIGNIELAREFSKNPLTKTFLQKPFDFTLERFPRLKEQLLKYKGGKIVSQMRNKYEEMNFIERARLHQEIFSELEKLGEAELKVVVPFLEGRLHFYDDLPGDVQGIVDLSKGVKKVPEPKVAPETAELTQFWEHGGVPSRIGRGMENVNPQRMRDFEAWYRKFQKEIEHGFKLDEKMTVNQLEDVIYKPIETETGLTREAIKEELGEFLPAYVHHFFPEKAADKLAVHFADTTGKRFKPGALKKRRGKTGYSEDMTEVLPRLASSYVKWKNTQAFLKEFEDKFATVVNFKDIKKTAAGLQIGEDLYPNHKIVSPDGILRFYKGEVDAWKEISKRMDDTVDFNEAVVGMFDELYANVGEVSKQFVGVTSSTKVWLVPEEAYGKLQSMATPFMGSKGAQDVIKIGWDVPQQIWKDSVLSLSPRWIKNNVMGDIIFNSFEGVGPFSYARAAQSYGGKYSDILPDEIMRASFANVMKYNPRLGSTEKTIIGGYVKALGETKPAKIARSVSDVGYNINTAIEQPFVRALYVKLARQEAKKILKAEGLPRTPENIITTMGRIKDTPELKEPIVNLVKETLPVFNTLDHFGRMYGRRAMPFINWYKFMGIYASKLPAKHPFKLAGVRGLSELGEKEREEAFVQYFPYMENQIDNEGGIPKRFSGLWPVGIDEQTGEGIFFNARGLNPFRTIEDILEGRFVNMMSPIVKVGVERSLGVDSFTGQKYTTPYPLDVHPDGDVVEVEKPLPTVLSHALRQFPQFKLLEQFLTPAQQYSTGTVFNPKPIRDSITGEPKYPIHAIDKILNYMGIDRKVMDVEKWFHKHEERIRGKAAQTHKNLLFDPSALTLEEHRVILQDIMPDEDEKAVEKLRTAIKKRVEYGLRTKTEKLKKIKESKEN